MDEKFVKAYLSLGSNAANGEEMLKKMLEGIAGTVGTSILKVSSVYYTEPQDYKNQPWFYNQAVEAQVSASLEASEFLDKMLDLETALGRVRNPGPRFGPRVADIDLLWFNNEESRLEKCVLPHPRITKRAFVLWPLQELNPDLPICGQTPEYWLDRIDWKLDGKKIYQTEGG